jgi:hypothetical protein
MFEAVSYHTLNFLERLLMLGILVAPVNVDARGDSGSACGAAHRRMPPLYYRLVIRLIFAETEPQPHKNSARVEFGSCAGKYAPGPFISNHIGRVEGSPTAMDGAVPELSLLDDNHAQSLPITAPHLRRIHDSLHLLTSQWYPE